MALSDSSVALPVDESSAAATAGAAVSAAAMSEEAMCAPSLALSPAGAVAQLLLDAAPMVGGVLGMGHTLHRGGCYEEGSDILTPLSFDARGDVLVVCAGGRQVWR